MPSQTAKELDQYYTKKSIADLCVSWYREKVPINFHSDLILEPSMGNGSFYNHINSLCKHKICMDLDPKHFFGLKKDFLKFKLNHKVFYNKVHVIGNPPFKQITHFFAKAFLLGDFVGFILPLSFKKDSVKNRIPLRLHCIFSKELPKKNNFSFENKTVSIPTVFQI